jgi:hypothetical protein
MVDEQTNNVLDWNVEQQANNKEDHTFIFVSHGILLDSIVLKLHDFYLYALLSLLLFLWLFLRGQE